MRRLLLFVLLLAALFVLAVGRASAWQKDPDSLADPAKAVESVLQLLAPPATVGDEDTTAPGVGDAPVGIDSFAYPTVTLSSSGTTYWVDNTPLSGDCPQATFVSIQAAVNASGPKDTVKVCPGTYAEQVQIVGHNHDGLRLESLTPLGATIQWPTPEVRHQLIYINEADEVTIRGFRISGPFPSGGCASGPFPIDRHEGILFDEAFEGRVDHNHITLIRDANPALWGCQQGDAVSIGRRQDFPLVLGPPASARIDHNLIDRYQKNGVQTVNPGSFADIDHNTINASTEAALQVIIASNGVVVIREAAAFVEHNEVANNRYTPVPLSSGIILAEAPPGSSKVNHNRVFNNDYGIQTDTQTDLEISHNDVFENVADGIVLCGEPLFGCGYATQIVVRSNEVEDNGGNGIVLFGADANLLKTNHVERNGTVPDDTTDGIRLEESSAGNLILENHMEANVTHDCHDDNPGGNTWRNNRGDTSFPPGLCRP